MADAAAAPGAGADHPVDEQQLPGEVAADGEMLVAFESQFFAKLGIAYFRLAENSGDPVMMVEYGEQEVALPLPGIRRELNLADDAPDAKMLDMVVKGLKFVNTLAVGDPLPSEIVSGKPSWALTPQHAQIAYQKLAIKLMTWMGGSGGGGAAEPNSPEEILQQFQDPEVRKKIGVAFGEAAEALGLGRDRKEEVVSYLETVAQELGYIEALRDKFGRVVKIGRRLNELRELGKKQRISDVIEQASKLMRPAVEQLMKMLRDVDGATADIIKVLKDLDGTIAVVREHRDELYQRMLGWNDLLDRWEKCKENEISGSTIDLASRTVRFLAPRFMPSKEWVLRFKEEKGKTARVQSWRSPQQQRDDMKKALGSVMRW